MTRIKPYRFCFCESKCNILPYTRRVGCDGFPCTSPLCNTADDCSEIDMLQSTKKSFKTDRSRERVIKNEKRHDCSELHRRPVVHAKIRNRRSGMRIRRWPRANKTRVLDKRNPT